MNSKQINKNINIPKTSPLVKELKYDANEAIKHISNQADFDVFKKTMEDLAKR